MNTMFRQANAISDNFSRFCFVEQRVADDWNNEAAAARPATFRAAEGPEGMQAGADLSKLINLDMKHATKTHDWFSFLCTVYGTIRVPDSFAGVQSIGPLQMSDVPLSAVDFHVSDILEQLTGRVTVQRALDDLTRHSWGSEGNGQECLKRAM